MATTADWHALYPFESHWLAIDSLRYHYLDEGLDESRGESRGEGRGEGRGEPLLMVHGNPTWSFYWRRLVLAFRDRYRIVVPDHVGCGLSDKPADFEYRLDRHIDNLQKLVVSLELSNITLLCHDWGGAIGLGTALRLPERFARLVIFNTGAFPPPYVPLRIRACRTPLLGRWAVQGCNLFARAALSMATAKPDRMTAAVKAGLLAPYDSWAHRRAIYRFVADIPLTRRHPTYRTLCEIEEQLPQLADRPIQLIWGMLDWCFRPECLERFIEVFPQADVHRLADAGHYVLEDAHERIVPLVERFLHEHPIESPVENRTSHP